MQNSELRLHLNCALDNPQKFDTWGIKYTLFAIFLYLYVSVHIYIYMYILYSNILYVFIKNRQIYTFIHIIYIITYLNINDPPLAGLNSSMWQCLNGFV